MFDSLRKAFRRQPRQVHLPQGQRIYAIGDIHGRLDLFDALIRAIEADDHEKDEAVTTMVLLGDLIDRGPDSAGVIQAARKWQERCTVRYLTGNHEEMFLEAFKSIGIMKHFLKHGGRETILSYGVTPEQFNHASTEDLQQMMHDLVPQSDIRFIRGFEEMITIGDYLFVHAGIDPKRPLSDQRKRDTRWIREPFLNASKQYSHMVIHGHSIVEHIDKRDNRIGIDTGAYCFGRLTALVLEGSTQRYIQAVEEISGTVTIEHKDNPE